MKTTIKNNTPQGKITVDNIKSNIKKLVQTTGVGFYGYPTDEFYGYNAERYGFETGVLRYE